MKPLTFYLGFKISPELESYLGSLSPEEKIEIGCGAVRLAKSGLQISPNMILYCPVEDELSEISPRNLAALGAGLINIGVDELDWDDLDPLETKQIEYMTIEPMAGVEVASIEEVPA